METARIRKQGGGRPRLEEGKRRSEKLSALVTPEIHKEFHKLCDAEHMTTSDLLSMVIAAHIEKQKGKTA